MKRRNYSKRAKNKKRKWVTLIKWVFYSFFGSLTIFFALFMLTSAYSNLISPEKSIFFAYMGLVFPFLLIINIMLLIYWLIVKKWLMSIILIASFVICWKPITVLCPFHLLTKKLPEEEVIKVLSYNVMSFAYKNHTKEEANKIIQYIAESDADIVCLQEYMVSTHPDLMSTQDVANALPMYPYFAEVFYSTPRDNRGYKYGLAVLSKFPILNSRKITLISSRYNGAAIHEIDVNGKKVAVVNNHLESFKLTAEDRSKYSDMITHVSFELFEELRGDIKQKLGQAFRIRAKQAEKIAEEIRHSGGYYTIACGDFNDTPISYTHRVIQGPLADAYAKSGLGMGISYNQNFFYFRIDHILHSPNMNVYNCRVDTHVKLSDHYPISCYLKLN